MNINILLIELNGNQLGVQEIEEILYTIWKFRKTYINNAISLNISNNPGSGVNLSQRALDIINGTANTNFQFLNEGLVNQYNWSVTS